MDTFSNFVAKGVYAIAGALMGGVLLTVSIVILGRYLSFNVAWADELARILFIWSVLFGAISATNKKLHFSVSFFTSYLNPFTRNILQVFSHILSIGVLSYIFVAAIKIIPVYKAQTLPALQITKIHFLFPLFALVIFMIFFITSHMIKDLRR